MRTALKVVGVLAIIVLIFFPVVYMKYSAWHDLQEFGYQTLVPDNLELSKKQQSDNASDGNEAWIAVFTSDTEFGKCYVAMWLDDAYEGADIQEKKDKFNNGETIEGYLFCSPSNDYVYYSSTIDNKEEFIWEKAKGNVLAFFIVCAILIGPFALVGLVGKSAVSEELELAMRRKDAVVCTYRNYINGWVVMMMFIMGGALSFAAYIIIVQKVYSVLAVVIPAILFCVSTAVYTVFMMKNWIIVLSADEIVHQSALKKISRVNMKDVMSCSFGSYRGGRYLQIITMDGGYNIAHTCVNYKKAVERMKEYIK